MNLPLSFSQLESSDLIRRLNEPDLSYIFKHALVQDTSYSSMLKQDRKRLHRLIGETLERTYPNALEENAARLAQHFAEAGDHAKTFHYARMAGDAAARVYANPEAITFYNLALQTAANLELDTAQWIALYTQLGRVYEVSSTFDRALARYQDMEQRAAERGDAKMKLASLMARATLYATPTPLFDEARGQALLDEALALAQQLQDGAAEARIYWTYLLLNGFSGRPLAALEYGEKGIALARALGLKEQLAYLLNDISSFAYHFSGELEKGAAARLEARHLWEELGNLPMLADNLNNSAIFSNLAGNYARAHQELERAHEISVSINNVWGESLANMVGAMTEFEEGEFQQALTKLRPSYDAVRKNGLGLMLIGGTVLSLVLAELGAVEEGYALIRDTIGTIQIPAYRAPSLSALAYLMFLRGDVRGAEQVLSELQLDRFDTFLFLPLPSILVSGERGLKEEKYSYLAKLMADWAGGMQRATIQSFVGDCLLYQALAQIALGETASARAALEQGMTLSEKLGSRRVHWKLLAVRAELEREPNPTLSQELSIKARDLLLYIADHTPEEYRTSFLNQAARRWQLTLA